MVYKRLTTVIGMAVLLKTIPIILKLVRTC